MIESFRPVLHLVLHVAVPAAVARLAWPAVWWRATLAMLATLAVDLDHLLADPFYAPGRCSLTTHPLHAWPMWIVYVGLACHPRTRWVGIGLVIHMVLDGVDCLWMGALAGR